MVPHKHVHFIVILLRIWVTQAEFPRGKKKKKLEKKMVWIGKKGRQV